MSLHSNSISSSSSIISSSGISSSKNSYSVIISVSITSIEPVAVVSGINSPVPVSSTVSSIST
jgi:hypothetical protein